MQVTKTKGPETKLQSRKSGTPNKKGMGSVSVENKPKLLPREMICDIMNTCAVHIMNAAEILADQRPGRG